MPEPMVRWLGARPLPQPALAGRAFVDVRPSGGGAIVELSCVHGAWAWRAHIPLSRAVTDVDQAVRDAAAVILGTRHGCTCGERLVLARRN